MIDERFIILAAILNFIGSLSYIIDTIKGKTKPNKVTWLVWSLAPLVAFIAQISQGVKLIALLTFMYGFMPLLIFISSFVNKNAIWKISKLDIFCGFLSVIGLIVWWYTKVGNTAIFISIVSDLLAAIPTLIKSYKYPETENSNAFIAAGLSAIIGLLTIKIWTFENYAFSVYALAICVTFVSLIKLKVGKRLSQ